MRTKAPFVVAAAVLLSLGATVVPLAAQSLADVARQEEARRKAIKNPSRVLTNKDLGAVPASSAPSSGGTTPAAGGTGPGAGTTRPAAGDADKNAADSTKGQPFWSGRVKDLQTQLEHDETFASALQSQINALTTQYVNQADPIQQAKVASDRQKTLDDFNRLTKQVADDKKAIADLQEEARRAGVPAGWLR